jgi:inosine-uridine nucleoside N-ribohydrolase
VSAHKVIFDTDPGIDDAMALLFLHHHRDIDLIGITSVFGNAAIETTTRNALYLKSLWHIAAPVARGAGQPIDPARAARPAPGHIHGDNGLGNVDIPETVDVPLDPRPAHRFIIETVRANPGEVTLIAVGRMTNLALALAEDPDLPRLVKQVIVMGGAVATTGNVSPVAEANIAGDPEAADAVMKAPWPFVLVGLDVTARTVMTKAQLAALGAAGGERAQFLADISEHYIRFYENIVPDGMMVHDSCACAWLVAPQLFTTRSGPLRTVCGGIADGQTIQKPDGLFFPPGPWDHLPSQQAAIEIDAPAVLRLIHETIVG